MAPRQETTRAPPCSNLRSFGGTLYWRKYLRSCWNFSTPLAVIRRPGNSAHLLTLLAGWNGFAGRIWPAGRSKNLQKVAVNQAYHSFAKTLLPKKIWDRSKQCTTMNVFFYQRKLLNFTNGVSKFCLPCMHVMLLTGRKTHASTLLMSEVINFLVHRTWSD